MSRRFIACFFHPNTYSEEERPAMPFLENTIYFFLWIGYNDSMIEMRLRRKEETIFCSTLLAK